jgi:hypothetical protein
MKRLAILGNSIASGAFASTAKNTLQAQLLNLLRAGTSEPWVLVTPHQDSSPTIGHVLLQWMTVRDLKPDVVCIAGFGENDYSSTTVSSITAPLPMGATRVTTNANAVPGRAYILTDGTNEEMIMARVVSGTTLTNIVRGAGYTQQRSWPAGTQVLTWENLDGTYRPAIAKAYRYVLRQIASECDGIVVVGAQSALAPSTGGFGPMLQDAIRDLVSQGLSNIVPVYYKTDDGSEMFDGNENAYTGPSARLTANIGTTDTNLSVNRISLFVPGEYVALLPENGLQGDTNSEYVKITAVTAPSTITVERAQLGSTAKSYNANAKVAKICPHYSAMRANFAIIGTTGYQTSHYWSIGLQSDKHPNDLAYVNIAKRFYEGIKAGTRRKVPFL